MINLIMVAIVIVEWAGILYFLEKENGKYPNAHKGMGKPL